MGPSFVSLIKAGEIQAGRCGRAPSLKFAKHGLSEIDFGAFRLKL